MNSEPPSNYDLEMSFEEQVSESFMDIFNPFQRYHLVRILLDIIDRQPLTGVSLKMTSQSD